MERKEEFESSSTCYVNVGKLHPFSEPCLYVCKMGTVPPTSEEVLGAK